MIRGLACAVLLAGCAAPAPTGPAPDVPMSDGRTIRDESAGFALDVPARLAVRGDPAWPFLEGERFGWHVSYEAADGTPAFEAWAVEAATRMLTADGPDGSSYCTGPFRIASAPNDHGLEAVRIGMVGVASFRPEGGAEIVETGPCGPIHAVRLPGGGPPRAVFLVPQPLAGDSVFPPVDEAIEDVARSVRAL